MNNQMTEQEYREALRKAINRMIDLSNRKVRDIVLYKTDFDTIEAAPYTTACMYIDDDDQILLRLSNLDDIYPDFGDYPDEDADWLIDYLITGCG